MDYIQIESLFFRGKHGFYPKERRVEQEFRISVSLCADLAKSGESDDLKDTVDYQKVKEIVRSTIEGGSRYLIEALAADIAKRILAQDDRVFSVEVRIQKTAVWKNGIPSVSITRAR